MKENDCIWQADCKDSDDTHCCEDYREKAKGHCYTDGKLFKTKIFIQRTKESER
jgi:hypothetical protein